MVRSWAREWRAAPCPPTPHPTMMTSKSKVPHLDASKATVTVFTELVVRRGGWLAGANAEAAVMSDEARKNLIVIYD